MAQDNYLKGRYTKCMNGCNPRKLRGKAKLNPLLAEQKYNHTLSFEQYTAIVTQNCYYCGCLPQKKVKDTDNRRVVFIHGIDRKDNAKGYTLENSVSCCSRCNYAKGARTEQEFTNWLKETAINMLSSGEMNDQVIALALQIIQKAGQTKQQQSNR